MSIYKDSTPVSGVMIAFNPFWPPLWTAGRAISGRVTLTLERVADHPYRSILCCGIRWTWLVLVLCLDKFRPPDLGCHPLSSIGFGVIL